jgi:2-keto-3-deoxy-L-rhamnonate aldolase RhmA
MGARAAGFRHTLLAGAPLLGTWIKTPSRVVTEVLSASPLDALCLDAEHAPFDRDDLDGCILAARALDMPALVRPPSAAAEHILNALDLGASGIVAPHVRSGADAEALARQALFGPGGRGYAGSTRAADFTRAKMPSYKPRAAHETTVIAQLEDREVLAALPEIVAVARIDCLFIGRIDLTVSLGAASPDAPEVLEALAEICARGREAGRRLGMFVSDMAEIPGWIEQGVSFFLLSSDQSFLIHGAGALRRSFDELALAGRPQQGSKP